MVGYLSNVAVKCLQYDQGLTRNDLDCQCGRLCQKPRSYDAGTVENATQEVCHAQCNEKS